MSAQFPPGFFGKLPCNGDFIQYNVSQEWLDVWDHWQQSCVHESRNALQGEWLEAYLSAPIWRFVLGEGACGSGAWAGIVVPSVDRVGRYFPITLVRQLDATWNPLDIAVCWAPWFEALEACACAALDAPDLRLDQFIAQVGGIQDPLTYAVPTGIDGELFANGGFPAASQQWQVTMPSADHLQLDVAVLAYREIHRQLRPVTLWWTSGSARVQSSWLLSRGLPAPASFAAMLDGSWRGSAWTPANPRALASTPARSAAPGAAGFAAPTPVYPATPASGFGAPPASPVPPATPPVSFDLQARLPTDSPSNVEGNLAAFVVRPEIGLWAVVTPNGETAVNATRTVADALQDVGPAATLTLLAESVRQQLLRVSQRLADESARNPANPPGLANVLAMVKSAAECAYISAGDAQVLRVRDGVAQSLIGKPGSQAGGDLLSLVEASGGGGADPCGSVDLDHVPVVYDRAAAGDVWLLGGDRDASDAAAAVFSGGEGADASMDRLVRQFSAMSGGRPPPLMMVSVACC
ncbi:MAG TPA: type VI secretion system-associated protein TagF [Steroidobacteraceae bacterium]|nr:type VI secretion system-associated protein TagF [Steroidobacteraceae bacterium]